MRIGQLDRRIIIQTNTPAASASGAMASSWATHATVWARVTEQGGREFLDAEQTVAEQKAVFRIRYLSTVTEEMRISYNGRFYDIQSIAELGRRVGLDINTVALPVT